MFGKTMIRIRTKKLQTNVRHATKKILMILQVLHLMAFMVQVTEQSDCGTYRAENGKICRMCSAGNYKIGDCMEDGMPARCLQCPSGMYQTTCNQAQSCALCSPYCQYYFSTKVSECNAISDIKCQCQPGFHFEGEVNGKCIKHKSCPPSQGVKMQGTPLSDTVCEPCIPGKTFSNVSTTIQQCQNCSTCPATTISECTSFNNTVCAIDPVDKGHDNGSHYIAIGLGVGIPVFILCIGLVIFYICRRRVESCSHYCGLPKILVQQQTYEVDEGKAVKLIAHVKNANTIAWTWNGTLLHPGFNGFNYFSVDNPSLILTCAVHSHGGEYILKASNKGGTVSSPPITLKVTVFMRTAGGYMVSLTRDSSDIEMDVEPIDQNDRDLHQNHVFAAAEHNNAGFPDIYFQNTESRDQTQPKERVSAAEQTKRIQQGNTEFREEQEVFPKEPVYAISPSRCRIPTAEQVNSILDTLTENIVKNFPTFFRFLVPLSVQHDQEPPNVNAWIEQEYENSSRNIKEAHYQLLCRWKKQHGGIDEKFCQNIKKALTESEENVVLAKLEHKFSECFFSS